jgi:hypothetical protein
VAVAGKAFDLVAGTKAVAGTGLELAEMVIL